MCRAGMGRRAQDILNSWSELEVECILRDYGEESNWQFLHKQIVKAWEMGVLHSTGDLVKLIQKKKCAIKKYFFSHSVRILFGFCS